MARVPETSFRFRDVKTKSANKLIRAPRGWLRILSVVLFAAALVDCGRGIEKPPAAPAANVVRPAVYVPADLDLVLRLDVRRYRETMGADPELSLEKIWESFGLYSKAPTQATPWLVSALKSTDTLWLGCRVSPDGCRDFVFVLRGRFASSRAGYGFGPEKNKRDLGGGWLSLDLESPERTSAARLYWRPPELAILVSLAEIDSAERSVEQSQDRTQLEPSETGLLSLVARSQALALILRNRSPKGAEWLGQSERGEIRFEPSPGGTDATFTVSFRDASQAQKSAEAFQILILALSGFDHRIEARNIDVRCLNSDVILRISFPTSQQSQLPGNREVTPP